MLLMQEHHGADGAGATGEIGWHAERIADLRVRLGAYTDCLPLHKEEFIMAHWTRGELIGSLSGVAAATSLAAQQKGGGKAIKITDLRCAIIGKNPVVRIVTDQGISGYGQAESTKPYLKPMVLFYKDYLIGEDPTDVSKVMMKIRRMGASKPWGSAVSAIEIAL